MNNTEKELYERASAKSGTGVTDEPVAAQKTGSEIEYPSTAQQALIILGLLLSSFLVGLQICVPDYSADIQKK